jgi:hypothetical protein
MPPIDLGVLDSVISVVVVILLLSMVVQSLQTFVKKISNFKSRQIEKSLQQLFAHVASSAPPTGAADASQVLEHFRSLGRKTTFGKHAVESISKADLTKVVASIEGSAVVPQNVKDAAATFFAALQDVQAALDALSAIQLTPESVAKLAELRTKLVPIVARIGNLSPQLVVADVTALSDLNFADGGKIVADLQSQIEHAAAASPTDRTLQDARDAVRALSSSLDRVQTRLTSVSTQLNARIATIETWYDTVMLGFRERYERHMRTWGFILSLAVTILLNADVFQVYQRIATDEVSKQRVLAEGTAIQQRYLGRIEQARAANQDATVQSLSKQLDDELDEVTLSYPALGIQPFDYSDVTPWSLLGWLLMASLLSLGAPFWHDTLESLFGLKTFLRDKTDTKKVEQKSGAGLAHT